jgi:DamX protein
MAQATAPTQPAASASKPAASQPVKPVAPTKPAPTQVATAKPAAKAAEKPAAGGTGNSGWYSGQKPGNYVVQILGTSSEASAQAFVKAQGGDYRYFKKTLQGKPLYVVTYGNFANRDAAVAAIKNLPAKVQAGKPWPRTVASVQQELASAR